MDTLPRKPPTVADVREFRRRGPWPSRSGGSLSVLLALPHAEVTRLFDYDPQELARLGVDIRGLRVFVVSHAPPGGVAGTEFHRVRTELAFAVDGDVRWEFEDLYGGKREVLASPDSVLCIPPFIVHAVTFRDAASTLVFLANTLYVPEDPRTHDSYPTDVFRGLQRRFRDRAPAP